MIHSIKGRESRAEDKDIGIRIQILEFGERPRRFEIPLIPRKLHMRTRAEIPHRQHKLPRCNTLSTHHHNLKNPPQQPSSHQQPTPSQLGTRCPGLYNRPLHPLKASSNTPPIHFPSMKRPLRHLTHPHPLRKLPRIKRAESHGAGMHIKKRARTSG